jgi:hypothetical protein
VRAAELLRALAYTDADPAHRMLTGTRPLSEGIRYLLAEATAFCVLRSLGCCYHACCPALAIAGVRPDDLRSWSSDVAGLYRGMMDDMPA